MTHAPPRIETHSAHADAPDQVAVRNILLRRLPPEDYRRLQPHLKRVRLGVDEFIARAGAAIDNVCFLEGGIAGFLDVLGDGRKIAVGVVGREGFVGWPLLLGDDRWPYDVVIRAAAAGALKVEAAAFDSIIEMSPACRKLLLRFSGAFTSQMGRTIVSNLIHPVDRRTARWLLLYHDRLDGDEIALTHEELGAMLGVRRSSVTDALHALEGRGLLRGLRGRVVIQDRAGLELLAGEGYGPAEAHYARLVGFES